MASDFSGTDVGAMAFKLCADVVNLSSYSFALWKIKDLRVYLENVHIHVYCGMLEAVTKQRSEDCD
jgi:hypothetical protein